MNRALPNLHRVFEIFFLNRCFAQNKQLLFKLQIVHRKITTQMMKKEFALFLYISEKVVHKVLKKYLSMRKGLLHYIILQYLKNQELIY